MTLAVLAAILATTGLAVLAQGVGSIWLYRQLRNLTSQLHALPARPTTLVDPAVRTLETRLDRLEAAVEAGSDARGSLVGSPPEAKRSRRLDRRQVALADGPVLIAVPSLTPSPSAALMAAAAVEFDRRFGPIWALADAGTPRDEIARQTGYPVGQVELILGLRGAKSGLTHDGPQAASNRGETDA